MTNPIPGGPRPHRNTRTLLIQQQRTVTVDLPLPLFLRSPYVALLWVLVLSTVVAALALGRMRVPRTAHGVVVTARSASDSLTPFLLLASSTRAYVKPGQAAVIDTGGTSAMTLVIQSVEPATTQAIADRRSFVSPTATGGRPDSARVVARLGRCHEGHCLPLAIGSSYPATASLGTRSLASYAVPRS